ncbi:MAG: hypothetical protein KJZ80_09305 [Hyphomicrobiaceae bacterium]|nr:hypothetical protein [Hyphomicrobiaceae bacterium]
MTVDRHTGDLAAFEHHLEVYGSRFDRWPQEARRRFEPLLDGEPRAGELLAEARDLERLLDRAPLPDAVRMQALSDRIVALAAGETNDRSSAPVIDLASRRRPRPMAQTFRWKVASALAASLLVGIYIGTSTPVVSAVEAIAGAVGLPAHGDTPDVVLFYDGAAADEEDLL